MRSHLNRRHFLASMAAAGCPQIGDTYVVRTDTGYVNPRKVLLWECTRKEIREALEAGKLKAAIVPTGSTEQHNEHLAMIHDTASAVMVAQNTALKLYPEVTVATPVPVGGKAEPEGPEGRRAGPDLLSRLAAGDRCDKARR